VGPIPVIAAIQVAAVSAVLVGERTGRRGLVLAGKPTASLAFLLLGWILLPAGHDYGVWIVVALLLCLVGDVLLMFPRAFLAGLVMFLLGHLAYVLAFRTLAPVATWRLIWAMPALAGSVVVMLWLWPHLGKLRAPVLAYVAAISIMLWGALATGALGVAPAGARAGALLFCLSDLSVARDRFVARSFANRVWGLPTYYLGQLLLAATTGA
jgi:uncharacterized membrane protein YhhN